MTWEDVWESMRDMLGILGFVVSMVLVVAATLGTIALLNAAGVHIAIAIGGGLVVFSVGEAVAIYYWLY